MQALIKMMKQILQNSAPTEMLSLFDFSENEREGQQVLQALAASKINSLKELNLGQLASWWRNEDCMKKLVTILSK